MRVELPFPRGQTATGGIMYTAVTGTGDKSSPITGTTKTATPDAGTAIFNTDQTISAALKSALFRPDLAGKIVETVDTVNGTNRPVLLRCVQNGTGVDITLPGTTAVPQRLCVQFSRVTGRSSGVVVLRAGVAQGAALDVGSVMKPIDDAYPIGTVIKAGDWFYVLDSGPCNISVGASSAVVSGHLLTGDADGAVVIAVTLHNIIGRAITTATGSSLNVTALVEVFPGVEPNHWYTGAILT